MAEQRGVRERRIVSVLFCDLVGFTDFSDGADPEDVDLLLEAYFSRARAAIESRGGVVEKFIGDAVVGVFGHPVAHDDDPERAVRAGLAIVQETAAAQEQGDPWLPVRVGVNTGEALLRRGIDPASGEGFLAGDSVNMAARIQHEAHPMTVLVGPETHAVTSVVFDYLAHAPVALRGKAEPVPVFEPRAALALVGTDLTRRHDASFVGRADDLAALTGAFEHMVVERASVLVRVVGEPGLGKSRLVSEFLGRVQVQVPELVWRTGRCLPYGEQAGIWALGEIVRAQLGVTDTDPVEVASARLEAALPAGPDRGWLRQHLLPLLGIQSTQPGSAAEQLAAWSTFLRETVAAGPAVLVFEDVHWADDTLLRFVHQLANDANDQALMVIVTTRPEHRLDAVVDASGEPSGDGEEPSIAAASQLVLSLSPLDETASRELLTALLAQPSVPDELATTVTVRANGNPLFLGELVRLLRDRELIAVDEHGAWQRVDDAEIPVPHSLQAVIAARFDLLPDSARTLLATASVLGRTFWPDAVLTMNPASGDTLSEDLALATERDLINSVPTTMTGHPEYAFFHALTRDVVYSTLTRDTRADRHETAAIWLATQFGERADEIADVLAHHYASAIDLLTATGNTLRAQALVPPAVHYLYVTGKQVARTDNQSALGIFERALAMAQPDHPDLVELLGCYALSLTEDSRRVEAVDAALRAVAVAERGGDESQILLAQRSVIEAAVFDRALTGFDVTTYRQQWTERVLRRPTSTLTIDALHLRAYDARRTEGRSHEAMADAERAVEIAEELGHHQCAALTRLGSWRLQTGDPTGFDDLERAISWGKETGDPEVLVAYINLVYAECFVGPARLLPLDREGMLLARSRGYRRPTAMLAHNLIDVSLKAGQVAEAESLRHHLDFVFTADSPRLVLPSIPSLAVMAELSGDHLQRQQLTDVLERFDVVELDRTGGDHTSGRDALEAAASLANAELFSRLIPHVGDLNEYQHSDYYVYAVLPLVRTAFALPDVALASRLIANLPTSSPMHEHALTHGTAMIEEHTGNIEQAALGYLDAAERWRSFTNVLYQAHALLDAARCLAALSDNQRARAAVTQAQRLYAAMPAPAKTAECDALLSALN